jgi:hypothetical protein
MDKSDDELEAAWHAKIRAGGVGLRVELRHMREALADDLKDGDRGMKLYEDILDDMRTYGNSEAVKDCQTILVPALDQAVMRKKVLEALGGGLENTLEAKKAKVDVKARGLKEAEKIVESRKGFWKRLFG